MALTYYHLDKRQNVTVQDKFDGTTYQGVVSGVSWLTLTLKISIPEQGDIVWKFSRRSGRGWRTDCPFILDPRVKDVISGLRASGVICPTCGDWIFSRANHDMHHCSCGDTYVDGGFNYLRVGFKDGLPPVERRTLDYHITRSMLYDDWNYGKSRFGRVPST